MKNSRYIILALKISCIATLLVLLTHIGYSQDLSQQLLQLPIAKDDYLNGVKNDWLVEKINITSGVFRNEKGDELILSNGLISRSFKITPNAATVSLKKLYKQEELIRAVKPEAIVRIDGFSIAVGGLVGQPNLAFLFQDWIDSLKSNPTTFQLKDFWVGDIQKRFDWARLRHHDTTSNWPPKGVHLKMIYALNNISAEQLLQLSQDSKTGREMLISDDFSSMSPDWEITSSESHERSSFFNEGKPGEIYTPKNTAVYAEQALPAGVRIVETVIDPGTDYSASWAPGIALLWKDKKIKFTFQTGTEAGNAPRPWKFIVFDGEKELKRAGGKFNYIFDKPWGLRLRIDANKIYCEARPQGGTWKSIYTINFDTNIQDPIAVRIGKLGKNIEGIDYPEPGELIRLKISYFAAFSAIKPQLMKMLENHLADLKKIRIDVNYELYDGIPAFSKWVEVHNKTSKRIKVDEIISEYLALSDNDPYNKYSGRPDLAVKPNIHLETDYAFTGQKSSVANRVGVHWSSDQDYETQISFKKDIPNQVKIYPEYDYHVFVESGESLESIKGFIMPFDSYEKERVGLAQRNLYRIIAPWTTENPMMFHLTKSDWNSYTNAVEQCAEIGYEMINFSFGSGFRAEDNSQDNYDKIDKYVSYADKKGIGLGSYSLLASRAISEKDDVINPETGKRGGFATFGNSPCLGSEWGLDYFDKMYALLGKGRLLSFTHDGSYPGDQCASDNHPGHLNLDDSQYQQWKIISDFYKWSSSHGIYLRIPDYYYLVGGNQVAVGYRENNWSLPRREQLIHTRQHIYDGTWESSPSMRWSFVPLQQYHGGGAAATVEPLNEHIDHYEMMLACNLGMGIQSVLRGPRLYDTDETKAMVKRMISWFKKYRSILESNIIHLRKADGRDIDYMMHVNPKLKEKGLLMVFNPTDEVIKKTIQIPLYYTGLKETASIREQEGAKSGYKLDREYNIELEVVVQPGWYNWYVIE